MGNNTTQTWLAWQHAKTNTCTSSVPWCGAIYGYNDMGIERMWMGCLELRNHTVIGMTTTSTVRALMCEPNTHRCNSMSHVQADLSRHILASGWLEQGVVSYNRKHGELMHHMSKTPIAWDILLSHETSSQSGRLRPDARRERDSWHEKTPNRDRKLNLHA